MSSSIRLAADRDAAAIAEIYRPIVESTAISFETEPPSQEEMRRRIEDTLPFYPWLVYERGGDVVGFAYGTKHRVRAAYRWSVDTSVYIHAQARRSGVGRALYASLFGILAAQHYFNAFAGITLPNQASVALHEHVGFQLLGVYRNAGHMLGKWHDVGWWQRELRAPDTSPTEPLVLSVVQNRPDWESLLSLGLHGRFSDR
jgi:L-amino acid N-acyltransferase YncA